MENNFNFDAVEIPSDGKLYHLKKETINVNYLNGADEDILTSETLYKSGEFLDILLKKKINEAIDINDLIIGDRNAILIWLHATAYGKIYKTTINNPNFPYESIPIEVDLSKLKMKKLEEIPDEKGEILINFVPTLNTPQCKETIVGSNIKFKLWTIGDERNLNNQIRELSQNKKNTYIEDKTLKFKLQIQEIDGNRDKTFIDSKLRKISIEERVKLREIIQNIEPDIIMETEVQTPEGEFFRTNIPIDYEFFYPFFRV